MSEEASNFEEMSPSEANEALSGGAYLLDVREDDEWEAGHAAIAHHIPLGELEDRYGEIPLGQPIVCVCRGGGRSARAAGALAGVGYTTINLAGGMRAWAAEGFVVTTDDGADGEVI